MKVKVYRNLHRKCFSIMDAKTRRVIEHRFHVVLKDAEFKISKAGQNRVRKEKKKNVHAFVIGEFVHKGEINFPDLQPREAFYNPYEVDTFIDVATTKPVEKAAMVLLAPGKIHYWK